MPEVFEELSAAWTRMYPATSVIVKARSSDIPRNVFGGSYVPPQPVLPTGVITIAGKYDGLATHDELEEQKTEAEVGSSSSSASVGGFGSAAASPYGKSNGDTSDSGSSSFSSVWLGFQTRSAEIYAQASLLARAAAGESIARGEGVEASRNWGTRNTQGSGTLDGSQSTFDASSAHKRSSNPTNDDAELLHRRWGSNSDQPSHVPETHGQFENRNQNGIQELYHHDTSAGAIQHDEGDYLSV